MSPSWSSNTNRLARYGILIVFAYFLLQVVPVLGTRFAPDDMQNIYTYWTMGPVAVLKAIVLCATPAYRPMGGAYYLPLYYAFGLNPVPYRMVCALLLVINFWLLYGIARRLASSSTAAVIATLIGCLHGASLGVYSSNACIYELLCFAFFYGAFLLYLRGANLAAVAALFILALDSKEMAVAFVPAIVLYEVFYRWPLTRRPLIAIGVLGLIDAAFVAAKLWLPNSISSYEAYIPVFTAKRFFLNMRSYLDILALFGHRFSSVRAVIFWIVLIVAAFVLRNKAMKFASIFSLLSLMPLLFVPMREGFVLYLPLAGLGIYFGELLAQLTPRAAVPVLFGVLLGGLGFFHYRYMHAKLPFTVHSQLPTATAIADLKQLGAALPRGSRILLVNTPFGNDWDMYFITKLFYRDPTLKVATMFPGETKPFGDDTAFDYVLKWTDGRLIEEKITPPVAATAR